jgi:single-strand DNA-binding protein
MSKSFAKTQILGHAGGNPVFQISSNGYAVAKFSVATNEQRKNTQTGEYVEHTSWHNVVAFDKLAEVVVAIPLTSRISPFCFQYLIQVNASTLSSQLVESGR